MTIGPDAPVPRWLSRSATGIEEVRSLCQTYFYPVDLQTVRGAASPAFSFSVLELGPLTVGELHFGSDIRLRTGDLDTAYHVNLPLSGSLRSVHRGIEVHARPAEAAVYRPQGETVLQWSRQCRMLCIKIDKVALAGHLAALTDQAVTDVPDVAPSLNLTAGAGLSWSRLVRSIATDMYDAQSLLYRPPVGTRIAHSVVAGLLYAVEHRQGPQLAGAATACHPRTVKRAIEAMYADPSHPFTMTELAGIAGCSVRTLQEGFRRHAGRTPTALLRDIRLTRAHDDLRSADPDAVTVAQVACRWGFTHLGRFAAAYRARFAVPPSTTLHG
jgi:AraC-like DNA-binding protein